MMEMNGQPPNQWILGPVTSAIMFLGDEHVLAGVIERSLITMADFPVFLELVATSVRSLDPRAEAPVRRLQIRAADDANFIKEEIQLRFGRVRAHHLVAMWAATETCIETTLQNCYLHIARAPEIARAHGYPTAKPANSAWEARSMVRGWRDKLKNVSELSRDEAVLQAFQIPVSFSEDTVRQAEELSEIRNCLIHNRGVSSSRLLKKFPNLQSRWSAGDEIHLETKDCERAFDVCAEILQSVLGGIVASNHLYTSPPST